LREGQKALLRSRCLEAVGVENSPQRMARAAILLARAGFAPDADRLARSLTQFPKTPLTTAAIQRIHGEISLDRGFARAAVQAFDAANAIEPAIRLKDYLARGYAASGEYGKAIAAFTRIADTPALLWETLDFDYPGILTDSLLDMAACAERARDRAAWTHALEQYALRRIAADGSIPGASEARRRLSASWTVRN
jgi:tetratricopeptide (TPR) repeat protein